MFNVTVINIKKSTRHMAIIITILIIIYIITKLTTKINASKTFEINLKEKAIIYLKSEIPAIESTYDKHNNTIKEDKEEDIGKSIIAKILSVELPKVENMKTEDKIAIINEENKKQEADNNVLDEAQTNVGSQIVTQNAISENYNIQIEGVKIKNETSFEINNSILEENLDINKNNITIFHTHTCESYTPSEKYNYIQTGNFRTTDLNFTVARVGEELTNYLTNYGFNVIHNKTFHDYPAYTGSYTRSLETVQNLLKSNPSDIIIDLHRDAIGSKSNYDPSVQIGDDITAQLMFVMGTNGGGLNHPNWRTNLKFAIEVQKKANELYPGLFKPMIVRNSRYNQHLGKGACIIEVGATGNTLEQCLNSMKYLSKVLQELLK